MVKKNLIGKLRFFFKIAGILIMLGLCGCSPGPVLAESEEQVLTEAVQEDCLQLAERDISAPEEPDFEKIFALNWDVKKDCYEEQGTMEQSLEEIFEPAENGLYELEVVALDSYGNSSVAKVFVLYDRAVTTLSEFENYVEKLKIQTESIQSVQKDGLDRRKAEEAFEKVNAKRIESGVHALTWDESLYELACIRAQEIVSNFSHQRPDGSYVGDVIIRQYGASGCGENIASNYKYWVNLFKQS